MLRYTLVATLVVGLAAPVAQAILVQIGPFAIDAGQEVPPTGEIGTGVGTVTLDTVTLNFSWNVSYQNLTGNLTAAHFHGPAPAGMNAGIQVPISGAAPSSGILSGSAIISPAQMNDLLAGLWYVNLHTTLHPGGEIRGQAESPCPWDCQDAPNGFVDIPDLFKLFGHWFAAGPCDFDGNGAGDINDLFEMFGNWGVCPP